MTRPLLVAVSVLTAAASLALAQPAAAQADTETQLGRVHFETSCNEAAQRRFDRGMRDQHSFWYSASREIFEDVLKADPDCAIAYWGIALSLLNNPFIGMPPASNLALGLAALEKGKAVLPRRSASATTSMRLPSSTPATTNPTTAPAYRPM